MNYQRKGITEKQQINTEIYQFIDRYDFQVEKVVKNFLCVISVFLIMADKKTNAALPASSAGLLRFFEDETKGVKVNPKIVICSSNQSNHSLMVTRYSVDSLITNA